MNERISSDIAEGNYARYKLRNDGEKTDFLMIQSSLKEILLKQEKSTYQKKMIA